MHKLTALTAGMLLASCGATTVEIRQPIVCAISPAVVFVPTARGVSAVLPVDLSSAQAADEASAVSAELVSATIAARNGQALGFAHSARVTAMPVAFAIDDTAKTVVSDGAPSSVQGGIVSVDGNGANLLPAVTQGRTAIAIDLEGAPPKFGFWADVSVCVGLQSRDAEN
ncbi:MAG: hypothetical protein JST54_07035 [Deltaproteobacteria bacterium]|nr:hypothetical protein [Deltaproteobacteria bacterium]